MRSSVALALRTIGPAAGSLGPDYEPFVGPFAGLHILSCKGMDWFACRQTPVIEVLRHHGHAIAHC